MGLRQVFLVRDDLRQCVSDWCFVLPRQTGSEELVEQRDWARSGGLSMPGPATRELRVEEGGGVFTGGSMVLRLGVCVAEEGSAINPCKGAPPVPSL